MTTDNPHCLTPVLLSNILDGYIIQTWLNMIHVPHSAHLLPFLVYALTVEMMIHIHYTIPHRAIATFWALLYAGETVSQFAAGALPTAAHATGAGAGIGGAKSARTKSLSRVRLVLACSARLSAAPVGLDTDSCTLRYTFLQAKLYGVAAGK